MLRAGRTRKGRLRKSRLNCKPGCGRHCSRWNCRQGRRNCTQGCRQGCSRHWGLQGKGTSPGPGPWCSGRRRETYRVRQLGRSTPPVAGLEHGGRVVRPPRSSHGHRGRVLQTRFRCPSFPHEKQLRCTAGQNFLGWQGPPQKRHCLRRSLGDATV